MKVMEVAFTGYPAKDLRRARHFYEDVLGLKPTQEFGDNEEGMVEYDIGPTTLSIGKFPQWEPSPGGGSTALEVDDFNATIDHLRRNGCKFYLEPFETPACQMAVVSDTEGNSVTILKRKPGS